MVCKTCNMCVQDFAPPLTWTVQFVPDTHNTRHCFAKNFSHMHNRLSVEALLMCCMWWNIFMWSSSISPKVVPGARSVAFSVNSPPTQCCVSSKCLLVSLASRHIAASDRCVQAGGGKHQLLLPVALFFFPSSTTQRHSTTVILWLTINTILYYTINN